MTVLDIITKEQLDKLRCAGYVVIDREPTDAMRKAFYARQWPECLDFSEGFHRMIAASIIHQNRGST